ncbi:uncharacterized protein C8Q71DRAFT_412418 [Rhodofomes roseus]|uniref:Uncharacterized protein n=1 Tax=Rhodofomes roseus TaxID=34475 RepID=A0ABQ8KPK6_9APHY|nr:uncharacterized protein C8Q71DRAFT_412418 [Rhodofomes roseus]KAH9840546.1 hypothetical protein C8Q71DRAFT_412418 [Rhodofomes roseus]
MSTANETSALPAGYTLLNKKTMISEQGKELAMSAFRQADSRNPDAHDMYIYNDYYAYGVIDIIDKSLSALHSRMTKKDWPAVMAQLEALTHFMEMESVWGMADDGERVIAMVRAYGACLVATLRALKKNGDLTPEKYPSLEYMLKAATSLGQATRGLGVDSEYDRVCQGIGKRLFSGHPREEARALHEARHKAWLQTLPADVQKEFEEEADDDDDEEEDEDDKPWWHGGVAGIEDVKDEDFVLSRVWKEYKDYLSECPTKPLRGPPIWDLDKWSQADKAAFSFDAMSDD